METHGLFFVVLIFLVARFRPSGGEIGNLLEVSKSFRQTFSTYNETTMWIWLPGLKIYYTCVSDAYLLTDKLNTANIREVTVKVVYKITDEEGKPLNTTNVSLAVSNGVDTKVIGAIGKSIDKSGRLQATILVKVNARQTRFGIKRPDTSSCLHIHSVQITYRYCPNQTFSYGLVRFPRTYSPPKGSVAVKVVGRCSTSNNKPLSYCESNGNWSYNETVPCKCRTGQMATTMGCFDLSRIIYGVKAIRMSNSEAVMSWRTPDVVIPYKVKCVKCVGKLCQYNCTKFQFKPWPRNNSRAKNGGMISGLVDTARYILLVAPTMNGLNESEYDETWRKYVELEVLPSKVRNLTFTKNESQHIILTWLPPINKPRSNVSYKVTCDIYCSHDNCTNDCAQLTYFPSQDNLLQTRVIVNGFGQGGSKYIFKVVAMNRWQNHSETRLVKWNFGAINYTDDAKVNILNKGKNFNVVDVVIGVSVLVLAVIIAVVVTKWYNKRRARKNGLHLDGETLEHQYNCEAPLTPSPSTHYVDPDNYENMKDLLRQFNKKLNEKYLKTEEVIGEGEFGVVWKGYLDLPGKQQSIVAVKCLRCGLSYKLRRDFLAEASVMGQFNDPNIISLHGVVVKRTSVKIVMEYMSNGSLDAYLLKNSGRLTTLQLLGMARGIAAGMKYLSGRNFIHRDLAARNILVDKNLCCKVSDFGLTREICKTSNYETRGGKIPIRWTAPEVIKYKKSFIASDVWSYGVVLWEIMAFGQRPYWKWDNFQVLQEIESGYRLPAPLKCPKSVHCLMLDCWKRESNERPPFNCIVDQLDDWIRSPETIHHSPSLNRNYIEDSQCPIQQWLNSIKMGKYTSNFLMAGYSALNQVAVLTENDLLNMGIKLVGHRHKIHQSIPLVVGCDVNSDVSDDVNDDVFVQKA